MYNLFLVERIFKAFRRFFLMESLMEDNLRKIYSSFGNRFAVFVFSVGFDCC